MGARVHIRASTFKPRSLANRIGRYFNQPTNIASLVVFRIGFGLLMAWHWWRLLWTHEIPRNYAEDVFHFTYAGFDWVSPLTELQMEVIFFAAGLLSIMLAVGFARQICAALMAWAWGYLLLIDKANYSNPYYLYFLLSFLLIFIPCEMACSIDARRKPIITSDTLPLGFLWVMRAQVAIAAIAGCSWLYTYGLLNVDGLMLAAKAVTHLRIFTCVSILSLTLFLPSDWPHRFQRLWPAYEPRRVRRHSYPAIYWRERLKILAWSVYFVLQVTIPLRHFFYPGDFQITQEGARFSWRPQFVQEPYELHVYYRSQQTPNITEFNLAGRLNGRQWQELHFWPDLVHDVSFFAEKELQGIGEDEISVYAEAKCCGDILVINPDSDLNHFIRGRIGHEPWLNTAARSPSYGQVGKRSL